LKYGKGWLRCGRIIYEAGAVRGPVGRLGVMGDRERDFYYTDKAIIDASMTPTLCSALLDRTFSGKINRFGRAEE